MLNTVPVSVHQSQIVDVHLDQKLFFSLFFYPNFIFMYNFIIYHNHLPVVYKIYYYTCKGKKNFHNKGISLYQYRVAPNTHTSSPCTHQHLHPCTHTHTHQHSHPCTHAHHTYILIIFSTNLWLQSISRYFVRCSLF